MPNVKWGGLQVDNVDNVVTGVGSQPGPVGGDGWQIVGRLPTSKLLASRHYAFIVSGDVHTFAAAGGAPTRGIVQVCLGDAGGFKHPEYRAQYDLASSTGSSAGQTARPFQFFVLFTSTIADPGFGPTWTNAADLVIWARSYRNGDPATYAPSFHVGGVTFLWWDLDAIPGGAFVAEEYYPARPPGGAPTLNAAAGGALFSPFLTANPIGLAGQGWAHFVNLWFTPRGNGAGPARFAHGHVTDATLGTWTEDVGTNLRWGTDVRGTWRGLAGVEDPTQQLGSHWQMTRPSGSGFALGFRGIDQHAVAGRQTLIHRWRVLSVRMDLLPNFATLHPANGNAALQVGARIEQLTQPPYLPWEPGPQQTTVASAALLVHGILNVGGGPTRSSSWWVLSNIGRLIAAGSPPAAQLGSVEGVPCLAHAEQGLGPGGLDEIQYRMQLLRSDGEGPPQVWPVQDVYAFQFGFVQDPTTEFVPVVPPSNPTVLVPTREGLAVSAQLDLPIAPDGAVPEAVGARATEELRGITGYSRSWFAWSIARRSWELSWAALRPSERDTLDAFWRANRTFRWAPPGDDVKVAAALLERPQFRLVDPSGIWSCTARAAELVHVGP